MKRSRTNAQLSDDPEDPPDVMMADDPPNAFYGLVLSLDEAAFGAAPADVEIHLSFDAALVSWYQALNVFNMPALDGVAIPSGARIFEAVIPATEFVTLNQYLVQNTNVGLEESTWWMLTPIVYGLRASVAVEAFLPVANDPNPASIALPNSRHAIEFLLPRLIVPRTAFAQILFSTREMY